MQFCEVSIISLKRWRNNNKKTKQWAFGKCPFNLKKMFHRRPRTDFLETLQVGYLSAETYQMAIVLID